jgi:hypothetical protein
MKVKLIGMAALALLGMVPEAKGQGPCRLDARLINTPSYAPTDTTNTNLPWNTYTIYGSGRGPNRTSPDQPEYNYAVQQISGDFAVETNQVSLSNGSSPLSGLVFASGSSWAFFTSNTISGVTSVTFWKAELTRGIWVVTNIGTQNNVTFPNVSLYVWKRGNQFNADLSLDGGNNYLVLGTATLNYWSDARGLTGLIAYSGDTLNLTKSQYTGLQYRIWSGSQYGDWQNFVFVDSDTGTIPPGGGGVTQDVTVSDTYSAQAQLYLMPIPPATTCPPNDPRYQQIETATMQFQSAIDIDRVGDVGVGITVPSNTVNGPFHSCDVSWNGTCTATMSVTNTYDIGDAMVPDVGYDQSNRITFLALDSHGAFLFSKEMTLPPPDPNSGDSLERLAVTTALVTGTKSTTVPYSWYLGPKPNYNCPAASSPPDYQPDYVETLTKPIFTPKTFVTAAMCKSTPAHPAWSCSNGLGLPSALILPTYLSTCSKHTPPAWGSYLPQ